MHRFRRNLGIVLMGTGLLGLLASQLLAPQPGQTHDAIAPPRQSCRVLEVIDGDTIACDLNRNGRIEKPAEHVRMLGIDTPEMHYSRKQKRRYGENAPDAPFAKESGTFTRKLLTGKRVWLETDVKARDPYERLLAHVYRSEKTPVSVGETLLGRGLATVLFIPPNSRHKSRFYAAEALARKKAVGVWSTLETGR